MRADRRVRFGRHRQAIPAPVLQRRLLLVLFALGTNMGIRQLAGGEHGGAHGETEAALRHVRRVFVNRDNLRRAIVRLVMPPWQSATRPCGVRAPPAPATPRSSAPGRPTC